jgi:hypothetical protein
MAGCAAISIARGARLLAPLQGSMLRRELVTAGGGQLRPDIVGESGQRLIRCSVTASIIHI